MLLHASSTGEHSMTCLPAYPKKKYAHKLDIPYSHKFEDRQVHVHVLAACYLKAEKVKALLFTVDYLSKTLVQSSV
eukprot:c14984_g1_i1 orf=201-428(-)